MDVDQLAKDNKEREDLKKTNKANPAGAVLEEVIPSCPRGPCEMR
jgi:hypothetical protein